MHHFFDHYNSFEPALKKPLDRFKALNIEFVSYAENCHKEFLEDDEITYLQLAQQAIESLYNSPVAPEKYTEQKLCIWCEWCCFRKNQRRIFPAGNTEFLQ
jgi:uncharacterized protein YkwD